MCSFYKCWDQSWGLTTKIFFPTDYKILTTSVGFTQSELDAQIGYFLKFWYLSKKITNTSIWTFGEDFPENIVFRILLIPSWEIFFTPIQVAWAVVRAVAPTPTWAFLQKLMIHAQKKLMTNKNFNWRQCRQLIWNGFWGRELHS